MEVAAAAGCTITGAGQDQYPTGLVPEQLNAAVAEAQPSDQEDACEREEVGYSSVARSWPS